MTHMAASHRLIQVCVICVWTRLSAATCCMLCMTCIQYCTKKVQCKPSGWAWLDWLKIMQGLFTLCFVGPYMHDIVTQGDMHWHLNLKGAVEGRIIRQYATNLISKTVFIFVVLIMLGCVGELTSKEAMVLCATCGTKSSATRTQWLLRMNT